MMPFNKKKGTGQAQGLRFRIPERMDIERRTSNYKYKFVEGAYIMSLLKGVQGEVYRQIIDDILGNSPHKWFQRVN
jgi:hypothetical protein